MSISQIIEGLGSVELALGLNKDFQKLIDEYTGKFNNVINQIRTANAKLDIISDLYAKNLEKQITRNEMEIYNNTNETNAVLFKKPVNKDELSEGNDEIYKDEMDKAKVEIERTPLIPKIVLEDVISNPLIPKIDVLNPKINVLEKVKGLKGFAESFGTAKYGPDFMGNFETGQRKKNKKTMNLLKKGIFGGNSKNKTKKRRRNNRKTMKKARRKSSIRRK